VTKKVAAVDLFCGAGGLTCGLRKAGLEVVAGIDNDASCRYAYEINNETDFVEADVSSFSSSDLNKLFAGAEIKILVGCAPCQTFSRQTTKYRRNIDTITDTRWNLLNSFAKYINDIQPHIVSMENVSGLLNFGVFKKFKSNLFDLGYHVGYQVIDCSKYGLPQKRCRLVLLASKLGDIRLLLNRDFDNVKTIRDVIERLPYLSSGEIDENDPLHRSAGLTDINLQRIKQSKPGGTWHDWDVSLLPNCYKKSTGKSYINVYGRLSWDEPAPTITTQFFSYGTGRFGHPEQDRALSLREGALLQTFPKNYKFIEDLDNICVATIARHIGNAVPVELGKIIGLSIIKHLEEVGYGKK
jgi:DNA (cytosine-5)-methyltransferase 1